MLAGDCSVELGGVHGFTVDEVVQFDVVVVVVFPGCAEAGVAVADADVCQVVGRRALLVERLGRGSSFISPDLLDGGRHTWHEDLSLR